jgi:hypothetical protein
MTPIRGHPWSSVVIRGHICTQSDSRYQSELSMQRSATHRTCSHATSTRTHTSTWFAVARVNQRLVRRCSRHEEAQAERGQEAEQSQCERRVNALQVRDHVMRTHTGH